MRERPILFSGSMVKALLSGAKSQTRRLIRIPPRGAFVVIDQGDGWWPFASDCGDGALCNDGNEYPMSCPYGIPGDRLWVRETWAHDAESLDDLRAMVEDIVMGSNCGPYYRADGTHEGSGLIWRPSIHMPRWASRITLEVTEVRVQRLQEISGEDARAEGIAVPRCTCEVCMHCSAMCPADASEHILAFAALWDELNGKRASWASNPWIWAISFKRVEQ